MKLLLGEVLERISQSFKVHVFVCLFVCLGVSLYICQGMGTEII